MCVERSIEFKATVPLYADCDVFIAGGGPAGCAAADAAASQGARVFLVEQDGCFGGMGTAGLVPFFTGYSDGVHFLCEGFGRRLFDRMEKSQGFSTKRRPQIRTEILKRVYDEIMVESGVSFLFNAKVVAVVKEENRIKQVIVSLASGLAAISAKVFIDATGDGILAVASGAEFDIGNEKGQIMPSSLCTYWSEIDWPNKYDVSKGFDFDKVLNDAIESKKYFKIPDWHHVGVCPSNATTGCANMGHIFGLDATNPESRTAGWLEGRRIAFEYEKFYNELIPGFENMKLVATASQLGIRESRRIRCDYTLVEDDYIERRSFEDEIGHFAYGIDIHPYEPTYDEYQRFCNDFIKSGYRYKSGEHYGIPYRALAVKGIDNLLVAGRCISADHKMIASIRVMPGCFITGQAAGIAATMCDNVHKVDTLQLQNRLRGYGAYI